MNNLKKSSLDNFLKKLNGRGKSLRHVERTVRLGFEKPIQGYSEFEICFYRNRGEFLDNETIEAIVSNPFQELPDFKYTDWNDKKRKAFTTDIRGINEQGDKEWINTNFQSAFIKQVLYQFTRWEVTKETDIYQYDDGVSVISDNLKVRWTIEKAASLSLNDKQLEEVA